ncbi:MAG: HAD-IIB family hydrolase [Lactobacillaceae bacterium]|jgi:Cof subfamily protein (haloacid dehalogenase superfamily)|nr:HAD-IIB family hydrolase [Lactobacillaceae bacterium]
MTVKIIASDMDGTFLSDSKHFDNQRFMKQLDFMNEHDIKFVAATGNKITHIKEMFKVPLEQGYQISSVASNGAATYDGDKLVHAAFLSQEQILKVINWNAKYPDNEDNLVVITGLKYSYVSNHATKGIIELIKGWYHDTIQVEKFAEVKDDILEVTFIWRNEDIAHQVQMLREVFGPELHSTGSGFGNVDILAANTNKATGMSFLQDRWHVSDDEVITFGDNENDIEMLRKFKRSYVMKNAEPFMLDEFKNVTRLDNNHDGVLDQIDKILEDI